MKILFYHCEYVNFLDLKQSNRPLGIINDPPGPTQTSSSNCLLAFICVEKWDNENISDECTSIIIDHLKMINKKNLIIVPFAHLSHFLADSGKAISILNLVNEKLENLHINVERSSFGYHKSLECILSDFTIYGHRGSVAYRQIPNNVEKEFVNLVEELGLGAAEDIIKKLKRNND